MIGNKTNDAEDDVFDDVDFDVQDDTAPAAEDAEWDALDEDASASPAKKQSAPRKKSSFGLLAIIAVVIAAAGGGFLLLSGGAAPPANPEVTDTAATEPSMVPVEVTDQNAPPMPTPIDGTESAPPDVPVVAPSETSSETAPSDGALTPLPGADTLASAPETLPSLDAAAIPSTDVATDGAADVTAAAPPEASPVEAAIEELPVETAADAGTAARTNIVPAETPAIQPMAAQILQQDNPTTDSQPEEMPAATPEQSAALQELGAAKSELEGKLNEANSTIASLQDTIRALEEKLAAKDADIPEQAPPAVEAPPVETPEPAPAPVLKTENSTSAAVSPPLSSRWVLRSARNDSAMVSAPGSNELKSVSVGDKLPGIGTIQSVGKVGGKWVVQGTHGQISR